MIVATILPHVDSVRTEALKLEGIEARDAAIAAIVPVIGMGATWYGYSDSRACTVVEVSRNGREITVREDRARLLNGVDSGAPDALQFEPGGFFGHTSGHQRWAYIANPHGRTFRFTRRSQGIISWVEVGRPSRHGRVLTLGHRSHHFDYNF